jgi:hypothetical protein
VSERALKALLTSTQGDAVQLGDSIEAIPSKPVQDALCRSRPGAPRRHLRATGITQARSSRANGDGAGHADHNPMWWRNFTFSCISSSLEARTAAKACACLEDWFSRFASQRSARTKDVP